MNESATPRVLIISHDVVGGRMAGPGIRAWQLAGVLAAEHPVTLVAPRMIDLQPPGFLCGDYTWGDSASLAAWLREADLVVANGFVLEGHPELAAIAQPLALDLYDPVLLENLELLRAAPPEQRADRAARDQDLLARQLAAGDFFLCATERQRDLYLGALMLAGRLTPSLADADPQARGLIDVAPFGLPAQPPVKLAPALRGALDGVWADDPLLLWAGGLWDWLDPLTLVEAMPQVLARHPDARLVFLAGRHPGVASEMRAPQLARQRAEALGLLGRQVFFYDEWVPYARRADFLLEATVAVSLHRSHLETAYAAVRSRFLDHLWAGLPSVVSDGDAAAELVRRHGLGRVVPPEDPAALAAALIELLDNPAERADCAARASDLAREFTWERTLAPLRRWARSANVAGATRRRRAAMEQPATESAAPQPELPALALDQLTELIRQAETLWRIGDAGAPAGGLNPRDAVRAAVRQAAAPVYQRQTEFNAVVVRALYWLMSEVQRAETQHDADRAAIHAGRDDLLRRLLELSLQLTDVEGRLRTIAREALPSVHDRLTDEELASTALAQEISRLVMRLQP